MQVDRFGGELFGDGKALERAKADNPPETLIERRAHLLAGALYEGRRPEQSVEAGLLHRAIELLNQE